MNMFIGKDSGLSPGDRNRIDFSLRVDTEENMYGPRVLVVSSLFNGDTIKQWMTAFDANEFILRSPELGKSIKSA